MLQCSSCGRQQERGKFCGSCGSALEEVIGNEEIATNIESEQKTMQELEQEDMDQKSEEVDSEGEEESEAGLVHSDTSEDLGEDPLESKEDISINGAEQITSSHQEVAATATQPVKQQQSTADIQGVLKKYWQYSVELLRNPSNAFIHKDDKFTYSLINLVLYALLFSLVIMSYVRSADVHNIAAGIDGSGAFFAQMIFYLFIIVGISLGVVLVSLLAVEKMFIKRMPFKQIVIQYSGLLMPLIFLQAIILLFTFIGTSFFVLLIMSAVLFYGLFFLTGIFMYEKVNYYQSSENGVYIAIGTTIFVSIALTIMSIIVGETLINKVFGELSYYF